MTRIEINTTVLYRKENQAEDQAHLIFRFPLRSELPSTASVRPGLHLLMESKEYSEALSVLSGLIKFCQLKWFLKQQTKDSGSKKLGMVAPQDKSSKEMKSSKKMKFASSSAETRTNQPDNNL
ncbi:hypothetical protein L3X38_042097 [Prunus dulcis]|uniref:Uncharacterized protein n=1 Tax=Prunus dulcis TaxID=3755 RepID=A0AAD4YLN3_PRUDU|nr:hypothetical protein L3X38_042097 [Prunus dulcis]